MVSMYCDYMGAVYCDMGAMYYDMSQYVAQYRYLTWLVAS